MPVSGNKFGNLSVIVNVLSKNNGGNGELPQDRTNVFFALDVTGVLFYFVKDHT
jgi:hypothetical protein